MSGVILGSVYLVASLAVMICNAIVGVVIVKSEELHHPTLWNIAFMAMCDFVYGLNYLIFIMPSAFLNRFAYSEPMSVFSSGFTTFLYGQSIMNVLVANIDRFLSVSRPLRYQHLMSAKRYVIAVSITVLLNICRLLLIIVPSPDVIFNPHIALMHARFNNLVSMVAGVGMPFIAFVVILAILIVVSRDIYRSRRQDQPLSAKDNSNRQFTLTMCVSTAIFCVSYFPTCIGIFWGFATGKAYDVPAVLVQFTTMSMLSNSLWNVIVYAKTYKRFSDSVVKVFCKNTFRRRQQMAIHAIHRSEQGGSEQGTKISEC